jgi:hypothetical protein
LHGLANSAYLSRFLFSALPCVAPYCAPGGIRAVSTSPSYRPTDHHDLVVELDLGQPENEPEQGAAADEHDRIRHREVAGERSQARDDYQQSGDQKLGLAHPSSVPIRRTNGIRPIPQVASRPAPMRAARASCVASTDRRGLANKRVPTAAATSPKGVPTGFFLPVSVITLLTGRVCPV